MNTQSALEKSTENAQALFENLKSRASSTDGTQNKSGKEFLAMQRALLVAMQRRILEGLAVRRELKIGWHSQESEGEMTEVDLEEEDEDEEDEEDNQNDSGKETMAGVFDQTLFTAMSSLHSLRRAYEKLTEDALDLYFVAGQGKNFERMLADLAVLKYQSRDYAGAANFFSKIIPIYSQLQWHTLEREMLLMHAKCLKLLNRRDDYVRMLLGIISKAISEKLSMRSWASPLSIERIDIESQTIDGRSLIAELLACSSDLPYEVPVEMGIYFQNITVEPYIRHFEDKEGFQLSLKFRSPFRDQFTIDEATVHLEQQNETGSRKVSLKSDGPILVSKGTSTVMVGCGVSFPTTQQQLLLINCSDNYLWYISSFKNRSCV
jgi:trafficking protein particle complex subunit 10